MTETIVIGDVHGCIRTLEALISRLPAGEIVLVGDLVDRGPASREVVRWARENRDRCACVVGNHERMMLRYLRTGSRGDRDYWLVNGGRETVASYLPGGDAAQFRAAFPRADREFLESLPAVVRRGDLVVSHAGWSGEAPLEEMTTEEWLDAPGGPLWYRGSARPVPGCVHVYGHTPVAEADGSARSIDIDTGCVFGSAGPWGRGSAGRLSALLHPSLEVVSQPCLD